MKTFKLKSLELIENKDMNIIEKKIPLFDGLIINREDEANQWLIEAYTNYSYYNFFHRLSEMKDEVLVQVKITKESNEPATFITSIIGINEIGDRMNVLFLGTMVDQRKNDIEEMLKNLIAKGYQGEQLLKKFKELI